MTKSQARQWMMMHAGEFLDCGEVLCAKLAEACATQFDEDDEGGPLDDELHWIWELAVEVGAWYEKENK